MEQAIHEPTQMGSDIADLVLGVIIPELDPFDPEEATAVMEEAQRGNPAAQYIMGEALECLLPPQLDDAREWYTLAAEQGYRPAQKKLESLSLQ